MTKKPTPIRMVVGPMTAPEPKPTPKPKPSAAQKKSNKYD